MRVVENQRVVQKCLNVIPERFIDQLNKKSNYERIPGTAARCSPIEFHKWTKSEPDLCTLLPRKSISDRCSYGLCVVQYWPAGAIFIRFPHPIMTQPMKSPRNDGQFNELI